MRAALIAAPSLLLIGCQLTPSEAEDRLDAAVERVVERDDDVRHAVLHVDAPALSLSDTWAHGRANAGAGGAAMTADTPFHSASVGKLFTAATVLSLAEEGALSLDDDLGMWLDAALLDDLPAEGAGGAAAVTVRQLLSHRSGLPDYFSDETRDGAPNVFTLLTTEPERTWTPTTLLDYTAAHFDPIGAPGEVFHYADTNYDLLGLVVEEAAGQDFHTTVRERVLDPLELDHTWYYNLESPPEGLAHAPADVWLEDHNAAGTAALSLDWAGGGLMTTAADLATFLRGLEAGTPVSLSALQEERSLDAITDGIDYGYGLWRVRPDGVSRLLSGPNLLGVSGVTGSFAYLIPENGAVITGTFDQSLYEEEHLVFILTRVLSTLKRVPSLEEEE